ncbi:amidohydrolase family protein [Cupriavidus basilensis]
MMRTCDTAGGLPLSPVRCRRRHAVRALSARVRGAHRGLAARSPAPLGDLYGVVVHDQFPRHGQRGAARGAGCQCRTAARRGGGGSVSHGRCAGRPWMRRGCAASGSISSGIRTGAASGQRPRGEPCSSGSATWAGTSSCIPRTGAGALLAELDAALGDCPAPVVLDHFGRPGAQGTSDAVFAVAEQVQQRRQVWVKLSAVYRLPPAMDWRALAGAWRRIVGRDRLLLGSDWPWTNHGVGGPRR